VIKTYTESDNLLTSNNSEQNSLSTEQSNAIDVWSKFLEMLSGNLKKSEVETWFSVLTPKHFKDNVLTLSVPSKDYYGMIERRFNKYIVNILNSGLLGENGKLNYEVIQETLFDNPPEEVIPETKPAKISDLKPPFLRTTFKDELEDEFFTSNLYHKNTFDNFVTGESNQLAVATAYSITNNLGKTSNPFFVYGGVGLGKTHLVQAIGNEILKKYPGKKVYYTTTPDFTTQFTTNIAKDRIGNTDNKSGTRQLDAFYKSLDVLILDDIQNLGGKPGTQDFIYQIFNTLRNNDKHIILSCDKPLNQIKDIEDRLLSRFQWGMTVDIQPPSWEMRVAIIRKKLDENKIEVPEEIIHYIASNVKDSIRVLEGCIASMITESILLFDGELTMEAAEKAVSRSIGNSRRSKNISVDTIIYTVSKFFNVSENQILTRKRTKDIAFARQVAMYLAKEMTTLTFESIGLNFGGKDHSTVMYSHKLIKEHLTKDSKLSSQIKEIKEHIKNQ
jgi:chromosomal replication initiator protein